MADSYQKIDEDANIHIRASIKEKENENSKLFLKINHSTDLQQKHPPYKWCEKCKHEMMSRLQARVIFVSKPRGFNASNHLHTRRFFSSIQKFENIHFRLWNVYQTVTIPWEELMQRASTRIYVCRYLQQFVCKHVWALRRLIGRKGVTTYDISVSRSLTRFQTVTSNRNGVRAPELNLKRKSSYRNHTAVMQTKRDNATE